MIKNSNIFSLRMLFIYSLAFLLIWEWLRPLPVITDTGNLHVFVLFTFFCLILLYVRLVSYVSIPMIFIAMIYCIHILFFQGSFLKNGFQSLQVLGEDIARNISLIVSNHLDSLSYEFRTLLLLLVLAIISYLVHYWLCHVKKMFLFIILTIIYVTVIDTFTMYDASSAIIRLFVTSFLLLMLLYNIRLEDREKVAVNFFRGKFWLVTVTAVLSVSVAIAFYFPKFAPIWPDPVPMVKKAVTGEEAISTVRTIGYGEDDKALGGGFVNDETVVFRALAKKGHYWRGESKEVYTGKGWLSIDDQENQTFRFGDDYNEKVAIYHFDSTVQTEKLETTVTMVGEQRFSHFFYPGEMTNVVSINFEDRVRFYMNYVSGKVGTVNDEGKSLFLDEYTISYHSPTFVIDELKTSSEIDPEHIRGVYLQLPQLPQRVTDLALEITEPFSNRYEKVKAIETYFTKKGYQYETKDVAVPNKDQDYVDQFLFETKKGYCDNFSTSMIVMLRTLEIPARWVKGFTQGQLMERHSDYNKYQISNSNAHSWVEVYFPDIGWVPFEPTKGFTNSIQFVEEPTEVTPVVSNGESARDEEDTPLKREHDPQNPFLPLEEQDSLGNKTQAGEKKTELKLKAFSFPLLPVIGIVVSSLILFFCFKRYKYFVTIFYFYFYKLKQEEKTSFIHAYDRLLWLLRLNGFEIETGETLREYAERIDRFFSIEEMKTITARYEEHFYGKVDSKDQCWAVNKAFWEKIVKKLYS